MQAYKREKYLARIRPLYEDKLIKVICGIRFSGKTTLMQQIAEELSAGVRDPSEILSINLEKRGYKTIKTSEQLRRVIDNENTAKLRYLLIDEIQQVQGFPELVKQYSARGVSVFIAGGGTPLSKEELDIRLPGAYMAFELMTLSFDEYLDMKRFYRKRMESNLYLELNHYIVGGGFPGCIRMNNFSEKHAYVADALERIFEKDIRPYVKIRGKEGFLELRDFLLHNAGSAFSVNQLLVKMQERGLRLSKASLSKYIRVLTDARVLYECSRFDIKQERFLGGEKKYYPADLSMAFAVKPDNHIQFGPILENLVYLSCRSRGYQMAVGRIGRNECDFILRDTNGYCSYVQVAHAIADNDSAQESEFKSLLLARDSYPKYIISMDTHFPERRGIRQLNIIDFAQNGFN